MNDHTPEPLAIGVIGLGIIGRLHVERLVDPDTPARLAAVFDTNAALAKEFGETHDVPAVTTIEDLVAIDDVDAVIVAVPSGLHRDLAVTALQAGKHVLLEKPIDISVEAADDVLLAAREAGKVVSVVSQRRFAPANQYIKKFIDEGGLGRVTSANFELPWWRSQEYYDSAGWRGTWKMDGGGALMNQGVHLVDLALWHLGDVEEVYAHTGLLAHERIEVEDSVTITARFKSGASMVFLATTAAHSGPPIRVSIMGDKGSIVTDSERIQYFVTEDGPQEPVLEDLSEKYPDSRDGERTQRQQLVDFVEAVRNGGPALVTPEQARNAVAFIQAVYESGRTGKPVKPAPLPE